MTRTLKVGIIGASAGRGWAKISHVPAVQGLPGLELAAVATNDKQSADDAAKAFGVTGHANAAALFDDHAIDIVAVAVKVPAHRELVLGALQAGKHLYCEWPLGRSLAEAEELAAAADSAGVHVAIGLQTRQNPAVERARGLLAKGAIGRVLSANVVSTAMAFGPQVEGAMAFAETVENGTNLVSIQGGHTIDLAIALLGELRDVAALTTTQFPEIAIGGDPVPQRRQAPDHILIQARLASLAPLTVEVAGGRPPQNTPFRLEIVGERGCILLEGGAPRGFQSGRLRLLLNGVEQSVEAGELAGMIDTAVNVAGVYARLRDDIANDTSTAPGFNHAVRLTRLIDDMLASSQTGNRKSAKNWPRP